MRSSPQRDIDQALKRLKYCWHRLHKTSGDDITAAIYPAPPSRRRWMWTMWNQSQGTTPTHHLFQNGIFMDFPGFFRGLPWIIQIHPAICIEAVLGWWSCSSWVWAAHIDPANQQRLVNQNQERTPCQRELRETMHLIRLIHSYAQAAIFVQKGAPLQCTCMCTC